MKIFEATMIAEGVYEPSDKQEWIDAWQLLLDVGLVWTLQGWFGRMATRLLEDGIIVKKSK